MDEVRDAYYKETCELLAEIECSLLDLEKLPDDRGLLECIFGAIHTIKGTGSMVGFDNITAFTHELETVFELVHDGKIPVTEQLINLTLSACDRIKKMVNEEKVDESDICEILEAFRQARNWKLETGNLMPDAGCSMFDAGCSMLDSGSLMLDAGKLVTYQIHFRPEPDILSLGMNPLRLLDELREIGECTIIAVTDAIPRLEDLNPECCHICWDVMLTSSAGIDAIREIFIFVEDICELRIKVIDEPSSSESQKTGNRYLAEHDRKVKDIGKQRGASSVRVPTDKLDRLVDLVGELVSFQTALTQKVSLENDAELCFIAKGMERLTEELRHNTLNIRMQPVGTMFVGFKRLVRDLSHQLGKEAVIDTEGEDTELDKNIIDHLHDPLMHIIRNSIDHGIELPEAREFSGKPRCGTVRLSAEHSGANVFIRVADDGAGIDMEKIRAKAEERKVIAPGMEIPEAKILEQVFLPGVSTAEKITDISGRGMGMDVVKRSIGDLQGSVDIITQKGIGTTLSLKLPLTLAIIDGLIVRIGTDNFIFPLSAVEKCMEMSCEDTARARKRNIMNFKGKIIPYLSLREIFKIQGETGPVRGIVISEANGEKVAFEVDRVIGQHQTVIKTLGKIYKDVKGISGATVLGNGTLALILDVNQLLR